MLYLLDANTLIDAKRDYYPIDRVPEFWNWLVFHEKQGNIKIPVEVYELRLQVVLHPAVQYPPGAITNAFFADV